MARTLGISYRRFNGWEPARTYVPTAEGGWTVTTEPEWDDQERAWMLALEAAEVKARNDATEQRCPVCGGLKAECQDPDNQHAWTGDLPTVCYRRAAQGRVMEQYKDDTARQAMTFGSTFHPDRRKGAPRRKGRT